MERPGCAHDRETGEAVAHVRRISQPAQQSPISSPADPALSDPIRATSPIVVGFASAGQFGCSCSCCCCCVIVPYFVEQIQFAATRGKERAEAEVARQLLDEGRGPTIGQYRTVVKAVQSSVVGVKASRSVDGQDNDEVSSFLFGPGRGLREQDQGSGVIVDAEGYIITNYHVVDRASDVNVELSDGSKHRAEVVGTDPATDLAVLKIGAANLTAAPWGKSSDLEVGDPVLAIGNPFGLARTVTAGILSATGRHAVVEHVNYQDFLQTDAAVNPGNSGGPLVNMKGQIVGINTAIVGPTYQGISFAIPSDMVHQVYDQLIKSGKVARGWLGVSMRELTPEESEKLGVSGAWYPACLPARPRPRPASSRGDIITKWNGKHVSGPPNWVCRLPGRRSARRPP